MTMDKVEIYDSYVIKNNTASSSSGLEWFTEKLSINHKRELRVYRLYSQKRTQHLLLPKAYVACSKYLKLEKLRPIPDAEISVRSILPNIHEFILLGSNESRNISDIFSSPVQSILRGIINRALFLGPMTILTTLKHLLYLTLYRPTKRNTYLIHKDLKTNQNMLATLNGVYFLDFGSSILTHDFFLTDIVELSTDHLANTVDFELLRSFIHELGTDKFHIKYLRSQIYLLLMRRTLHFGPKDLNNPVIMSNVKQFHKRLDGLVKTFCLN